MLNCSSDVGNANKITLIFHLISFRMTKNNKCRKECAKMELTFTIFRIAHPGAANKKITVKPILKIISPMTHLYHP